MKYIFSLLIFFSPSLVLAAGGGLNALIVEVGDLIGLLIPIAASLVLLVFFFGIAKFMLAGGDEEKIKSGKKLLLWGTIALFIIAAIWGIIEGLQQITGTGGIDRFQSNFGGTIWNAPINPTLPPPP